MLERQRAFAEWTVASLQMTLAYSRSQRERLELNECGEEKNRCTAAAQLGLHERALEEAIRCVKIINGLE